MPTGTPTADTTETDIALPDSSQMDSYLAWLRGMGWGTEGADTPGSDDSNDSEIAMPEGTVTPGNDNSQDDETATPEGTVTSQVTVPVDLDEDDDDDDELIPSLDFNAVDPNEGNNDRIRAALDKIEEDDNDVVASMNVTADEANLDDMSKFQASAQKAGNDRNAKIGRLAANIRRQAQEAAQEYKSATSAIGSLQKDLEDAMMDAEYDENGELVREWDLDETEVAGNVDTVAKSTMRIRSEVDGYATKYKNIEDAMATLPEDQKFSVAVKSAWDEFAKATEARKNFAEVSTLRLNDLETLCMQAQKLHPIQVKAKQIGAGDARKKASQADRRLGIWLENMEQDRQAIMASRNQVSKILGDTTTDDREKLTALITPSVERVHLSRLQHEFFGDGGEYENRTKIIAELLDAIPKDQHESLEVPRISKNFEKVKSVMQTLKELVDQAISEFNSTVQFTETFARKVVPVRVDELAQNNLDVDKFRRATKIATDAGDDIKFERAILKLYDQAFNRCVQEPDRPKCLAKLMDLSGQIGDASDRRIRVVHASNMKQLVKDKATVKELFAGSNDATVIDCVDTFVAAIEACEEEYAPLVQEFRALRDRYRTTIDDLKDQLDGRRRLRKKIEDAVELAHAVEKACRDRFELIDQLEQRGQSIAASSDSRALSVKIPVLTSDAIEPLEELVELLYSYGQAKTQMLEPFSNLPQDLQCDDEVQRALADVNSAVAVLGKFDKRARAALTECQGLRSLLQLESYEENSDANQVVNDQDLDDDSERDRLQAIELSASFWKKNKGKTVDLIGELTGRLKKYEAVYGEYRAANQYVRHEMIDKLKKRLRRVAEVAMQVHKGTNKKNHEESRQLLEDIAARARLELKELDE